MKLFSDNADFYPTPDEVINTMMMGENFIGKTILEPSAGKGNIVDWLKKNGAGKVIACEKDSNIKKILNGKCDIIADDFLSISSEQISHVDYIVMNPPFSEGAKHILHAFEIAPAGCTIIALCNSRSVNRGCWERNATKEKLVETIELYGREEFLGAVFDGAERKTDVHVSMVKLYKEGEGQDEFDGYLFSDEGDALDSNEAEGLVQYNVVRDMVNRYVSAVRLFDETMAAAERINSVACLGDESDGYIPVRFAVVNASNNVVRISRQHYKKELQKFYWRRIFAKLNMKKYATQKLQEQINKFVEQQTNVPFTMHNIYQVLNMVVQTAGQRMDAALLEAFDLICSLSAENSTAGEKWKTNANYMVNRKFIVPYMTGYDTRWPRDYMTLSYSSNETKIADVVKALCYITGINYDDIPDLHSFIYNRKIPYGEWFEWAFFRVKGFKKGTMHFEFLDEDVWMRFNQQVAKQRGWVLPKKKR
nr:MAG TPA: Type I restriction enzyme [Caudoviricetes sp.]